jgi:hypothetical protein
MAGSGFHPEMMGFQIAFAGEARRTAQMLRLILLTNIVTKVNITSYKP